MYIDALGHLRMDFGGMTMHITGITQHGYVAG